MPPVAAFIAEGHLTGHSNGRFNNVQEAMAVTGLLSAMLLIVGTGARGDGGGAGIVLFPDGGRRFVSWRTWRGRDTRWCHQFVRGPAQSGKRIGRADNSAAFRGPNGETGLEILGDYRLYRCRGRHCALFKPVVFLK